MKELTKEETETKILVVDDEAEIRELLSDFLETAGYAVKVAKSGNEALSKVEEFLPDLVMLDIILPDLDGVSVYEILRKNQSFSKIPVVFFSALGPETMPPAFSRQNANAPYSLLRKPINSDLLIREIKKLLKSSS